jgi:hypothetical protein
VVPRRDAPWFRLGTTKAYLTCVAPGYLPYEFTPGDSPSVRGARVREGQVTVRMRGVPALTHEEMLGQLEKLSPGNLILVPAGKLREIERAINTKRDAMGLPASPARSGELK